MSLLIRGAAALLLCACAAAQAKVSEDQAKRLLPGGDLTPLGGERAGTADGRIPEWKGAWTTAPKDWKGPGTRLTDPFAADKLLFTITADNVEQYRKELTVGQLAMFKKYPRTYRMPVYGTRRTAGAPKFVVEATYQNALKAELGANGEALVNAVIGIPFPIPSSGKEVIWNHKVRYRGLGARRWNAQAAVTTSGSYNLSKLREDIYLKYATPGIQAEQLNNVGLYFLQVVTEPPRLAGTLTLVHETLDQVKEPRRAWQYNPGQRRLRRAPNVGYDNPGTASDGLRTNDQTDTYNGATDRYTWKIAGKKIYYMPYNAWRIHSDKLKYKDILTPGHINQAHTRYEARRVWVLESNLREGTSHIYKRRTFYLDEDSWQILAVDIYDKRDQLWRVQESHSGPNYQPDKSSGEAAGTISPLLETVYDLQSGRYLAQAMNNEDPETAEMDFSEDYFEPDNVKKLTSK
ncbi:MAG TPA: DUF1329 domain-containing protein [Solimonas sp.]|nr:DUF1329 domain-containing protein [Solimonas sp.]